MYLSPQQSQRFSRHRLLDVPRQLSHRRLHVVDIFVLLQATIASNVVNLVTHLAIAPLQIQDATSVAELVICFDIVPMQVDADRLVIKRTNEYDGRDLGRIGHGARS